MQSVETKDLDELNKDIDMFLKKFPKMRKKLHDEFGEVLKKHVDLSIGMTINDPNNKIKRWQKKYIGSGGGYAAIRAEDSSVGNESPGAITNYVESGHRIRKPSGKNKYYRPKIHKIHVDGAHFYEEASRSVEADIISAAEDFIADLIKEFE